MKIHINNMINFYIFVGTLAANGECGIWIPDSKWRREQPCREWLDDFGDCCETDIQTLCWKYRDWKQNSDLRKQVAGSTPAVRCRVTTWMANRLWAGKPSLYVTSHQINSAFHPYVVGKSSTGLSGCG